MARARTATRRRMPGEDRERAMRWRASGLALIGWLVLGLLLAGCQGAGSAPPAAKPSASAPTPAAAQAAAPAAAPTAIPTSAAAAPREPDVVKMADTLAFVSAPLMIAVEKGFFREQGIEPQIEVAAGGA